MNISTLATWRPLTPALVLVLEKGRKTEDEDEEEGNVSQTALFVCLRITRCNSSRTSATVNRARADGCRSRATFSLGGRQSSSAVSPQSTKPGRPSPAA